MRKKLTDQEKLDNAKKRDEAKKQEELAKELKRQESVLEHNLKNVRHKNSNALTKSPNSIFNIGDKVNLVRGNLTNLEVLEVLDDGKTYLVKSEKQKHFYSFLELISVDNKTSDKILSNSDTQPPVRFYNNDIDSLLHYHYKGINYSPNYQRGLVWSQENKERLIESLMSGLDIGKFIFIELPFDSENPDSPQLEILDGKQRLTTLVEFFENKITYKGLKYRELNPKDKGWLNRQLVSVAIGRSEDWTENQKINYFLKVNFEGVPQSREHFDYVKSLLK